MYGVDNQWALADAQLRLQTAYGIGCSSSHTGKEMRLSFTHWIQGADNNMVLLYCIFLIMTKAIFTLLTYLFVC